MQQFQEKHTHSDVVVTVWGLNKCSLEPGILSKWFNFSSNKRKRDILSQKHLFQEVKCKWDRRTHIVLRHRKLFQVNCVDTEPCSTISGNFAWPEQSKSHIIASIPDVMSNHECQKFSHQLQVTHGYSEQNSNSFKLLSHLKPIYHTIKMWIILRYMNLVKCE